MSQVLDAPHAGAASSPSFGELLRKILKPVASLTLTVVLLSMCMWLVFCGTWAQRDDGIWTVVRVYFRSWFVWIPLQIFAASGAKIPSWVGVPFPGGWTLGFALLFNLLAAHITRFQFRIKRAGIWLIHSGIILLLFGELLTGLFATEGHMVIAEGGSANFIEDSRHYELVFVDPSDANVDQVVTVPASLLKNGAKISDPKLPVDIEVVQYMHNSTLHEESSAQNRATAGLGLESYVEERPVVSGVETKEEEDRPSAYLHLREKSSGADLGTWLVSLFFQSRLQPESQAVTAGGKPYRMYLWNQRTYKPYTIHLQKFTHDKYVGTETPKDYRSHIRLVDPEENTNRETEIYMNTPLRYRGDTFYQSGVLDPRILGKKGTILQVVRNPSWLMPYVSCTLVSLGMLVHFGIHLVGFLTRRAKV
ncbi:MAG TPA: cytochrome c biogenesis protein ResB [Gemmataceae bacterium]|nr:cytochrome c biogenesis protein ResB [Gemmataceae bacterium]